ncbi:hypothetical protein Emed_000777 [Eimeria media]
METLKGMKDGPVSYLRNSTFTTHAASRFVTLEREKDTWREGATLPLPTTRQTYKMDRVPAVNAPAWDVMEQKILKFNAYFKEHVDESREGNHRTRPCDILYYLELSAAFYQDDTMQIVEAKRDNSGMNHGTLVKRHRFPNESALGRLASPADLQVGGTFSIYGKTFAITGCDAFTRPPDNQTFSLAKEAENGVKCTQRTMPRKCRQRWSIIPSASKDSVLTSPRASGEGCDRQKAFILFALAVPQPKCSCEFSSLLLLQVGSTVVIADREFFIYAADEFARSFVKDTLGIQLRDNIKIEGIQGVDSANSRCEEASNEAKRAHEDGRPFEPQDFIIGSTIVIDQQAFRLLAKAEPTSVVKTLNDEQRREQMLVYLKRLWEGLRGNDVATKGMFTGCDEVAHKAKLFSLPY